MDGILLRRGSCTLHRGTNASRIAGDVSIPNGDSSAATDDGRISRSVSDHGEEMRGHAKGDRGHHHKERVVRRPLRTAGSAAGEEPAAARVAGRYRVVLRETPAKGIKSQPTGRIAAHPAQPNGWRCAAGRVVLRRPGRALPSAARQTSYWGSVRGGRTEHGPEHGQAHSWSPGRPRCRRARTVDLQRGDPHEGVASPRFRLGRPTSVGGRGEQERTSTRDSTLQVEHKQKPHGGRPWIVISESMPI